MKTRDLMRCSLVIPVIIAGTRIAGKFTKGLCEISGVRKGMGMCMVDLAVGLRLSEFVDKELLYPFCKTFAEKMEESSDKIIKTFDINMEKASSEPKLDDGPDECAFLDEEIGEKNG